MNQDWLLLLPILLPILSGICLLWVKPDEKGKLLPIAVVATLALNLIVLLPILLGGDRMLPLFTLSDDLPIFLRLDTAGRFFSGLIALVWAVAGCYSFEYMAHERYLIRYYAFYLMTLGVLMGLSFAGSVITFYMFYESMTLLSVPLVMHTKKREAVAGGIKYLIYSVVGASLALLGVFLIAPYARDFSFAQGGALDAAKAAGHESVILWGSLLMLLGFGAKAGMFPLHGWLPTAHPAAPSPASAVLSGVITKAGVLGILRVIYQFVGTDLLRGSWVQVMLMSLSLFTVLMGSMLAFQEQLLKKRLAWSTVSQVSYVVFGLSAMHPVALFGALLHVVAHSLIKDTLFMGAGAIICKTGKTRVDELRGIGKQMPVTMWCFTIASLGLIGIPPCLGFVSKWYLAEGALGMTGVPAFFNWHAPAVLLISALLTAGYLLPISIRGFLPGRDANNQLLWFEKAEPTYVMLLPLLCLTVLSVLCGLFPQVLEPIVNAVGSLLM